jgi:4-amino-4-deoxy-L-arabinose transferase-like glycosyltransferase
VADRGSPIAERTRSTPFRRTRDSGRRTRDALALTALCLLLYLPGLATLPPVDRDEARFMQTTRQMVESGDFVRPRFQSEDRFRKPIGIYWLQTLSLALTSGGDLTRVWAYRLPSTAGALAAVLLTYLFGAMWYPRAVALTAAALLATSVLLVVEAHLATTDAALLALIVVAQGCLGVLYMAAQHGRSGSVWYAAGFWLAQGLAILIKGPVAPMISALTIIALAFTGRAHLLMSRLVSAPGGSAGASPSPFFANIRWHWGIPLMLLVVLPWAIAVGDATDGAFFQQWWHVDVLPKLVSGHESHGAPPGAHLFMLPATFWPGSLALIPAAMFLRTRRRAAENFCLAWIVPAWLMFEIAPTKLPHYILPLLPPVALVCARAILGGAVTSRRRTAIAVAVTATVLLSLVTLGMILPNWNALWLSREAADAIARYNHKGSGTPLAAVGYHEPSLVFLTGGKVELVDRETLAAFMQRHPAGLGLVTMDEHGGVARAAGALGFHTQVVWSGDGINYSKGRRMRLLLLARAGDRKEVEGGDAAPLDRQALVAR